MFIVSETVQCNYHVEVQVGLGFEALGQPSWALPCVLQCVCLALVHGISRIWICEF